MASFLVQAWSNPQIRHTERLTYGSPIDEILFLNCAHAVLVCAALECTVQCTQHTHQGVQPLVLSRSITFYSLET